jgi:hypothetical protein
MKQNIRILLILALLLSVSEERSQAQPSKLPRLTRTQMLSIARRIAEYEWVCQEKNQRPTCQQGDTYECPWKAGEKVVGIAYDWGGWDTVDLFAQKLSDGKAAGSHKKNGVTDCTAGTDCSGFVSRCWGQEKSRFSTRDMRTISAKPKYNWFAEMKPGDAMVKPGSHIVLFDGYDEATNPIIFEASGGAHRVVHRKVSWKYLEGYFPLVYNGIIEE